MISKGIIISIVLATVMAQTKFTEEEKPIIAVPNITDIFLRIGTN